MDLYKKKYERYTKFKSYIWFSIGYMLITAKIIDSEIVPELIQLIVEIGCVVAIFYILFMLKIGLSDQKRKLTNCVLMPFGKRAGYGASNTVISTIMLEQLYYCQTEQQYLNMSASIAKSWADYF